MQKASYDIGDIVLCQFREHSGKYKKRRLLIVNIENGKIQALACKITSNQKAMNHEEGYWIDVKDKEYKLMGLDNPSFISTSITQNIIMKQIVNCYGYCPEPLLGKIRADLGLQ